VNYVIILTKSEELVLIWVVWVNHLSEYYPLKTATVVVAQSVEMQNYKARILSSLPSAGGGFPYL